MRPTKIAIYSGEIPSTTFIERLIRGLAHDGFQIYLFGSRHKKVSYSKNVFQFSYANKIEKIITLIKYTLLLQLFKPKDKKKLDKIIASNKGNTLLQKTNYYPVLYHKPDIFHLQWGKGIANWIWVQDFDIKLLLSLRGTHITISPIADANLTAQYVDNFPLVDGFHAVSNSIKEEAIRYGANPSKIKVIYSGLETEKLPFLRETTKNKKLEILSIGRSHWVKGYNYALEAFSLLKNENCEFQYTIIGVENDEELLFQKSQLDLDSEVTFKKSLPFQNIVQAIRQSDILLLTSVEEGIANVVLEAMATGTIVLSTNCGGMDEVITDGKNGFLVPIRNPQVIAEKIKLISNLSAAKKEVISLHARKTIENQHRFDTMIFEMKELYSTILNATD